MSKEKNIDNSSVVWQGCRQVDINLYKDDDITNIMLDPATLYVNPNVTGNIKVLLAFEETPRIINSWEPLVGSIKVKKVYETDTTVNLGDIKLYL